MPRYIPLPPVDSTKEWHLNELDPDMARTAIYHAAVNCELIKARARVRAMIAVKKGKR